MTSHAEFSALIPWYVNGTLDEGQRARLEEHLALCAPCRAELQLDRRLQDVMTADRGVTYMPAPSLKRLQMRLDALDAAGATPTDVDAPGAATPGVAAPATKPARRDMPWRSLMAASVVITAVALGLFTMDRWRVPGSPRSYHTVTTPSPRVPDEVIRAVFQPSITLVELQRILDESQLRIVAGPTEAGVYSLAANSHRPVVDSLDMLRKHAAVRFAESTQPAADPP
jgi:anti-sigma factor RsiW